MSTIPIYNRAGETAGEVVVSEELLVLDKGEQAVHDVIVAGMNSRRAGTASTLSKSEVAGSGKKPWRQKGTGRARAGYRQSPVWRGGGIAFGPKPRYFGSKINKKVAQLAFCRVLSERIKSGSVKIVEDLSLSEPRTKLAAALLKNLGAERCLLITYGVDPVLARATRNLPDVETMQARDVGVYHLMRYPMLVVSRPAWAVLEERLSGVKGTEASK